MSSNTISNIRQIRFDSELAKPSPERPRVDGLVYPRVAQIKGESNRQGSFDLHWKLDCLSTAGSVADAEVTKVAIPASPPRSPRMSFVREMTPKMSTPKLPSTPLSNLLHSGKAASILCTPPLLCSSRLSTDSRSLDGASSYYSQSSSSSDSD